MGKKVSNLLNHLVECSKTTEGGFLVAIEGGT